MTQQEFFDRYHYNVATDKIGGGRFGKVYKAYDLHLDKFVAIKVSEVEVINGCEFSLRKEFEAVKHLPANKHIANYEAVYTFKSQQGVYDYAIIQYYPDGNLKELLDKNVLLQKEKEDLAIQILEGLKFLHDNNVVHRDLKPGNILIHCRNISDKKSYVAKIADFGLSKIATPDEQSRFSISFVGGTIEYSSPEQLLGNSLRFNTDLWAWAVISSEMLTGNALFDAGSVRPGSLSYHNRVADNIFKEDIAYKLSFLPNYWQKALLGCLVRNPDTRTRHAETVLQTISNLSAFDSETATLTSEEGTVLHDTDVYRGSTPPPTPKTPPPPPKITHENVSLGYYYLKCLKDYTNFKGRARRKEYWSFTLFNSTAIFVLYLFMGIGYFLGAYAIVNLFSILVLLFILGTLLPSLAVIVRRLHDVGKAGGWLFMGFVPIVGGILLLIWFCTEGEYGANRFGQNPKN